MSKHCNLPNCTKPIVYVGRGWCKMHHGRWWRHGDPLTVSYKDRRNPIIKEDHALIHLGVDGKNFAIVDVDSPALAYNWYLDKYPTQFIEGKRTILHNYLLPNTDPSLEVDHINRNKLDNRLCNLRLVTHSFNATNRWMGNNKSGVRGVVWDKYNQKWKAYGAIHGKRYNLKSSRNFDDAVKARKEWEILHNVSLIS